MSHELHTGQCVGGPLDGKTITTRTPAKFLAANKRAQRAWIYQRQGEHGHYEVSTEPDDSLLGQSDGVEPGQRWLSLERATLAAAHGEIDVIAVTLDEDLEDEDGQDSDDGDEGLEDDVAEGDEQGDEGGGR